MRIIPCLAVDGSVTPPGSKSITNRAIVCAALAEGTSRLSGVLDSEDTRVMIAAWQQLGLTLEHDISSCLLHIEGCGGRIPVRSAELSLANSGTSIRFLTAALAACGGSYVLDGVPRMRERPIGDLLRALEQLGCSLRSLNTTLPDCPPVAVDLSGMRGGMATVAGNISSQYLSAIMMAAPGRKTVFTLLAGSWRYTPACIRAFFRLPPTTRSGAPLDRMLFAPWIDGGTARSLRDLRALDGSMTTPHPDR